MQISVLLQEFDSELTAHTDPEAGVILMSDMAGFHVSICTGSSVTSCSLDVRHASTSLMCMLCFLQAWVRRFGRRCRRGHAGEASQEL